jgi:hypothetical protein
MKGVIPQGIPHGVTSLPAAEITGRQRSNAQGKTDYLSKQLGRQRASAATHIQQASSSIILGSNSGGLRSIKSQLPLASPEVARNPLARPGRLGGLPIPQKFIGPLAEPQYAMPITPVTIPKPQKIEITNLLSANPQQGIQVKSLELHSSTNVQTVRLDTQPLLGSGKLKMGSASQPTNNEQASDNSGHGPQLGSKRLIRPRSDATARSTSRLNQSSKQASTNHPLNSAAESKATATKTFSGRVIGWNPEGVQPDSEVIDNALLETLILKED